MPRSHATPRQEQKLKPKKIPSLNQFRAEPHPGLRWMSPLCPTWAAGSFAFLTLEGKKNPTHPLCFASHSCSCQRCHTSARHRSSVRGCCVTAPGPRCLLVPSLPVHRLPLHLHCPVSETRPRHLFKLCRLHFVL